MSHEPRARPLLSKRTAAAPVEPFAAAFRTNRIAMLLTDPRQSDNPIVAVNDAFVALTGYGPGEAVGRNCRFLQGPETSREDIRRLREAIAAGEGIEIEILNYRKGGTPFWNRLLISPVRDEAGRLLHFSAAQFDVSDTVRTRRELIPSRDLLDGEVARRMRDLQAALDEKTALLRELDHRVTNNLQTVNSLILLKARRAADGAVRQALQSMAERIGALSTAHRLLTAAGAIGRLDLSACVGDLAADLAVTLADGRIALDLRTEPVAIPASKAAPAALLVGELLTNALKHAYPGSGRGRLGVTVGRHDGAVRIVVEDEGIGLANSAPREDGFGRALIDMLVRQLRAGIAFEDARPGTRVVVDMPLDAKEVRL